ncbi:hypothetical protein [Citrobacter sp. JGM124]|nr:hypothetical protein [Citrobacter sp. JGM124]
MATGEIISLVMAYPQSTKFRLNAAEKTGGISIFNALPHSKTL